MANMHQMLLGSENTLELKFLPDVGFDYQMEASGASGACIVTINLLSNGAISRATTGAGGPFLENANTMPDQWLTLIKTGLGTNYQAAVEVDTHSEGTSGSYSILGVTSGLGASSNTGWVSLASAGVIEIEAGSASTHSLAGNVVIRHVSGSPFIRKSLLMDAMGGTT